ncbi:hypothetical protein PIB30_065611 [Stylosanthes scabra]|uniref:CCHC-type domain-containing protein n=1 Tax=Stylosanthes scabra TaxID=79078 RepID=A0ABU6TP89_9FABA|nr:hypothetical protein [Stylosanthes scabra]
MASPSTPTSAVVSPSSTATMAIDPYLLTTADKPGPNHKLLDVQIRYEQIGSFCFCCGHIGHEVRNCNTHIEDSLKGDVLDEKWGEWLRSDQGGRRVLAAKENVNPNLNLNEGNALNKPTKPFPVNLIRDLASLSMNSQNVKLR